MNVTKKNIKIYLEKYLKHTCDLKNSIEGLLKNPFQTPTYKLKYDILKNNKDYKNYPYLIEIIEKVKKDANNYSKDDLQPCEEVKTTTTDSEKSDGVKESTPPIVEEQKKGK